VNRPFVSESTRIPLQINRVVNLRERPENRRTSRDGSSQPRIRQPRLGRVGIGCPYEVNAAAYEVFHCISVIYILERLQNDESRLINGDNHGCFFFPDLDEQISHAGENLCMNIWFIYHCFGYLSICVTLVNV
jgi:hypothetical protein